MSFSSSFLKVSSTTEDKYTIPPPTEESIALLRSFPGEVLAYIFGFLSTKGIYTISLVCSRWNTISKEDYLHPEKYWLTGGYIINLYNREFTPAPSIAIQHQQHIRTIQNGYWAIVHSRTEAEFGVINLETAKLSWKIPAKRSSETVGDMKKVLLDFTFIGEDQVLLCWKTRVELYSLASGKLLAEHKVEDRLLIIQLVADKTLRQCVIFTHSKAGMRMIERSKTMPTAHYRWLNIQLDEIEEEEVEEGKENDVKELLIVSQHSPGAITMYPPSICLKEIPISKSSSSSSSSSSSNSKQVILCASLADKSFAVDCNENVMWSIDHKATVVPNRYLAHSRSVTSNPSGTEDPALRWSTTSDQNWVQMWNNYLLYSYKENEYMVAVNLEDGKEESHRLGKYKNGFVTPLHGDNIVNGGTNHHLDLRTCYPGFFLLPTGRDIDESVVARSMAPKEIFPFRGEFNFFVPKNLGVTSNETEEDEEEIKDKRYDETLYPGGYDGIKEDPSKREVSESKFVRIKCTLDPLKNTLPEATEPWKGMNFQPPLYVQKLSHSKDLYLIAFILKVPKPSPKLSFFAATRDIIDPEGKYSVLLVCAIHAYTGLLEWKWEYAPNRRITYYSIVQVNTFGTNIVIETTEHRGVDNKFISTHILKSDSGAIALLFTQPLTSRGIPKSDGHPIVSYKDGEQVKQPKGVLSSPSSKTSKSSSSAGRGGGGGGRGRGSGGSEERCALM